MSNVSYSGGLMEAPSIQVGQESRGPLLITVSCAMMALSFTAVLLRFFCRRVSKTAILWDDWLILMALPVAWISALLDIWGAHNNGFGQHMANLTTNDLTSFLKGLFAEQIVWGLGMALTKFSILCFYWRFFCVPRFKIFAYLIGGMVAAWLLAMTFVNIFSCTPVYGFWDKSINPVCVDSLHYYLGSAIPNIVTDIMILALPLPFIWRLQVSSSQRFAVSGIFLLGSFVVLASALRLNEMARNQHATDITWDLAYLGIWTAVETNIAVVCACLPSMGPLLKLMIHGKLQSVHRSTNQTGTSGVSAVAYYPTTQRISRTKSANEDMASLERLRSPSPELQRIENIELGEKGIRKPQKAMMGYEKKVLSSEWPSYFPN